jgi:hypothetical protein
VAIPTSSVPHRLTTKKTRCISPYRTRLILAKCNGREISFSFPMIRTFSKLRAMLYARVRYATAQIELWILVMFKSEEIYLTPCNSIREAGGIVQIELSRG